MQKANEWKAKYNRLLKRYVILKLKYDEVLRHREVIRQQIKSWSKGR